MNVHVYWKESVKYNCQILFNLYLIITSETRDRFTNEFQYLRLKTTPLFFTKQLRKGISLIDRRFVLKMDFINI